MSEKAKLKAVSTIKYKYVLKNKHTGEIHFKWYTLKQIEKGGLSALFDVENYEIINRDRFIGLQDKNGVDIYEGGHFGNDKFPVVFTKGCFCIGSIPLKGYLNGEYMEQIDKVIGNIHDKK